MLSENNDISNNDWIDSRIHQLHERMKRTDYRGYDPFDLPNSPLFRFIKPEWKTPQLLISKFGSRIAPIALRKMLGVPRTEDPKIYACAYFGYKFLGDEKLLPNAEKMLDGIIRIGRESESGISWGYDFTWPTLSDGVNPRGASTIVPASFALLALIHETVTTGNKKYLPYIRKALKFYSERHLRRNDSGIFLGYFTHSTINTHNANLLGCAAMSLGARLIGDERLLQIAADATHTSLLAVDEKGYIEYNDGPSGQWTDSFHHLYVIAALRAIVWANPLVDAERCNDAIDRLWRYYTPTFIRDDGQINYYPGTIYPIDSHNYAATAIFYTMFGDELEPSEELPSVIASGAKHRVSSRVSESRKSAGNTTIEIASPPSRGPKTPRNDNIKVNAAKEILRVADSLTWDNSRGYYLHRIHKNRKDRREFLRWNQAWMFLALCMVKNPSAVKQQLQAYNEIMSPQNSVH